MTVNVMLTIVEKLEPLLAQYMREQRDFSCTIKVVHPKDESTLWVALIAGSKSPNGGLNRTTVESTPESVPGVAVANLIRQLYSMEEATRTKQTDTWLPSITTLLCGLTQVTDETEVEIYLYGMTATSIRIRHGEQSWSLKGSPLPGRASDAAHLYIEYEKELGQLLFEAEMGRSG